jgi:hypothetical protein
MEWADKFTNEELFFMVNGFISYLKKDKENVSIITNELQYDPGEWSNTDGTNRHCNTRLQPNLYQRNIQDER